ncbi:MAG TPA: hypothetical protein VFW87_26795 [Pirellulales bacterium]|nr:hypothetical protein [Pirellulales bacterium]
MHVVKVAHRRHRSLSRHHRLKVVFKAAITQPGQSCQFTTFGAIVLNSRTRVGLFLSRKTFTAARLRPPRKRLNRLQKSDHCAPAGKRGVVGPCCQIRKPHRLAARGDALDLLIEPLLRPPASHHVDDAKDHRWRGANHRGDTPTSALF